MKIRRSLVSALMIAIIMLSSAAAFGEPGNVDGSGGVNLSDVIMSLQVSAGLTPSGVSTGGDANSNGKIGLEEAIYGLQVVAQLRTPQTQTVWYKDADGDGYSDGTSIISAARPSGDYYKESELIAIKGDINDSNPNIFPVGATTEITHIKAAIQTSEAQWTAAPNAVSVLPKEDKIRKLGAIIPSDLATRAKKSYTLRDNPPASFDWRNNKGNFVTPVRDQGGCGSCWAFATTAALESQGLRTSSQSSSDLSEQIVLSCSNAGSCGGGYVSTASDFLQSTGTSMEACYSYTATDGNCNDACANRKSNTFRIDSWDYVSPTVSDIKNAVFTSGPVVTLFAVYSDFFSYQSGVYSYTSGYLAGYHAVAIVGWDDAVSAFIVKNSWGTWWGESGYFRIAYSEVTGATRFGFCTIAYSKNAPCTYTISPMSNPVAASGGSGSVSVTGGSGCSWTASSNANWITITSGSTGSGNGTVSYSAAQNTSASSRTGTLTIAGNTFTVTQAGLSCTYAISPESNSVPGSGGTGSVSITAASGCSWTAASNAGWITITSDNKSGSGNGTISYSVAQNTGIARTGTLSIADKTFTVTQSANCAYTISSANSSVAFSGGSVSVNVAASDGCAWTAISNTAWITVTSGQSGMGNGTVSFNAAQNTGIGSRSGTLTIAGQTHTVTQDGDCAYTISDTTTIPASGGSGSVNITASGGCQWTITGSADWISITSNPGGIGNGTISYSVAANTGSSRSGFLSIAGKALTLITQLGVCSYTISPKDTSVSASGGTGSVSVTAQSGCNLTASSNADWITVTSVSNTAVSYSVAANTGGSRTGTLTIGGQTFTVTQSGASSIVIFPDKNLEAAIRAAINKPTGDILISDVHSLTSLNAQGFNKQDEQKIKSIEGIQYCINLNALLLDINQISDISSLTGLTNLTELSLNDNQISNISPLAGLTKLTWLQLIGNQQISNISPLIGLTNLNTLFLDNNQISDISALTGLTNLTELSLNDNHISNINALAGLINLTRLTLIHNQIGSVSALAGLTNLTQLYLGANQISNIGALAGLTNLTELYLSVNQISNIGVLAELINLTTLDLGNNQLSNISALAGLTKLRSLMLVKNQISNISALAGLINLSGVALNINQISDISPLLINNSRFNNGVSLNDNPLSTVSCTIYIPQLQSRGATVSHNCP